MFDKYTEAAVRAVVRGQNIASDLGHRYVGSEHILYGILQQDFGIGPAALKRGGLDYNKLKAKINLRLGKSWKWSILRRIRRLFFPFDIPFTPRTRKMLAQATINAEKLQQGYVRH